MKTYFNTCPLCGAHLDPNEDCECSLEPATTGSVTYSDISTTQKQEDRP